MGDHGTRLAGRCFGARSERFAALQAVWDDISSSITDALVADFRRRCALVIEANGASIWQLLSPRMRQPRPCDVWSGEVATWSEEQDRVLLRWVRMHGRKWKELSRSVEALARFSAAELKTRYLLVEQAERNAFMEELQRLLGELGDDLPLVTADFVADIGEDEEEEVVMRGGGVALRSFCGLRRPSLLRERPGLRRPEVARLLAAEWRALTDDQRAGYVFPGRSACSVVSLVSSMRRVIIADGPDQLDSL